jgi:hypothetical protein
MAGSLEPELEPKEQFFLEEVLRLTGREERLARRPVLTTDQKAAFRALLPEIRQSSRKGLGPSSKCDLLNRLILSLGIKPLREATFEVVFSSIDFDDEQAVHSNVEKFRTLCMLEFGSFRYGYKILRTGKGRRDKSIKELWSGYFPTVREIEELVKKYKEKPGPIGLIPIPPAQLSALGYLSGEATERVNTIRSRLRSILEEAIRVGSRDVNELSDLARRNGVGDLASAVAGAGIPDGDRLLYHRISEPGTQYRRLLEEAKASCEALDANVIHQAQEYGKQNTMTYLAMHDVDVYVATSMRDPIHFANNYSFVHRLFGEGELKDWHLRYFVRV